MRSSRLVLLLLLVTVRVARADPAGDATKAFTAFVDATAAGTATPGLALFITPFPGDQPVPADLGPVKQLLDKPKVKVSHVAVSRGGTSAWLVGEITAKVPRNGKRKAEALRASALLALERGGWRVKATQWSATTPNERTDRCGMMATEWELTGDVPKELVAPVTDVIAAFHAMPAIEDSPFGGDRAPLTKLIADDPGAVVIGSAPGERFVGGKAIKALFQKWNVAAGISGDEGKGLPARAGAGPDGELMWMAFATSLHAQCTEYRTFAVLAKQAAGWRLVHQHYARHIAAP
ncbi:MAG: hypothetical protein ABIY55_12815 [Kofleriaceae bacterium]